MRDDLLSVACIAGKLPALVGARLATAVCRIHLPAMKREMEEMGRGDIVQTFFFSSLFYRRKNRPTGEMERRASRLSPSLFVVYVARLSRGLLFQVAILPFRVTPRPFRHCRVARVYVHTTTAMHKMDTPPLYLC